VLFLGPLFLSWLQHGAMTASFGIESPLEDVRICTCTSDSGITVLSNCGRDLGPRPVKLEDEYSLAAASLVTIPRDSMIYDICLFASPCSTMKPQTFLYWHDAQFMPLTHASAHRR
jgi:hypothetical protein